MPIQHNLVPDWNFTAPVAGPPNADWTGWVETENNVGGIATVEAAVDYVRFGAYSLQLSITDNADSCDVTSAAYIPINNAAHYVLRFSHYKVSGADTCDIVIKQYSAVPADLGDDIVITPTGAAAWGTSQTVIHAAGDGGNDWNALCTQVKIIIRVDTTVANWRIDGVSLAPAEADHIASFGTNIFAGGYEIAELVGISGPDATADVIDATSHDSDFQFREFISGIKDGGSITLEGVAIIDLLTSYQNERYSDLVAGTTRVFHVIFPSAAAEWCFDGDVTAFSTDAPYDDKLPVSITVKVTGKPVLSTASFA